jgi:hypothetical protein
VSRHRLFACLSSVVFLVSTSRADPVSFREEIAPVLREYCLSCHSGPKPKGDLDLTSAEKLAAGGGNGPVVVPGKPKESPLVRMVLEKKMPPKEPLAPDLAAQLERWVAEGAKWEAGGLEPKKADPSKRAGTDFWSLQPIRRPAVPADSARNPVDAFVLDALKRKSLTPNPEADRRTLIRRVSLDLTGLWPSYEEVEAFARDSSPNAYEKLVDRLLASPAYGERWGRHWLDVVRFAESHGYEMNTLRPNAWPYRDWVIRAFNSDLPFEGFVREQLAGDTLTDGDDLTQAATGFLVGGAHDLVGNATVEGQRQQRSDDLFDMVATTSTAFIGLTVGCARCHDHKFDPIAQRDFYSMEAMFAGVDHAERPWTGRTPADRRQEIAKTKARLAEIDRLLDEVEPLATAARNGKPDRSAVNPRRNVERFAAIEAKYVRFTVLATNDGTQPCIDEIEIYTANTSEGNVALATTGAKASASSEYPNAVIHKIAHLNDGQHGNGRSWISNEPGKGWAQIELAKPTHISKILWGRDREQKFRDRLATDYRIEASLDGKAWTTVAGSWDRGSQANPESQALVRERDELQAKVMSLGQVPTVYAGNFHPAGVTHLLKRGDVMQPGEPVVPAAIKGIGPAVELPMDAKEPDRRRVLANWIADPKNPLPARVMVNRVWHYHFGRGLVRTPSDFGFNGDRPSHPELLDWLAAEFQANGGRLKPLHRLICLSQTYRQSSRIEKDKAAIDADDRLLWRFPSRRIEAEAVRDNVLQATGSLSRTAGGPGYNLWEYSNYVTVFAPKKTLGPDEFRRMVYQFKPRTQQDGTFGVFDCPDATTVVPRRGASTTALQALNLLNDEFMFNQADRFAARVKPAASEEQGQVIAGFRLAFQRAPSPLEREAAERLIRAAGLPAFCRMLLNANEFVTLE